MKIRFIFLFLLLGQSVFGQVTDGHIKVAGTKCSLVPPEGFVTASNFSGFQNANFGASIMITEMPASFQTINESFTADALKTKGMTLMEKQEIDFNNSKATFLKVSQSANGTTYLKQILIFGDDKNAILVNGIYPEASKALEPTIKNALLSTIYNPSQSDDPLEAAAFSVDIAGTEFKLVRYMSGSLIYATDGKIPTEKPTLIVGNSFSKVSPQNQKDYCIERLKKLPRGEFNVITEMNEITINNLKGYEIIADGKSKDSKKELIYQIMLFTDSGGYFIILGQAKEDFPGNLEAFKKIAKTFKRK